MKFQDIVRCKRRELGLTQEQAARRLGVSPAAVSKLRNIMRIKVFTMIFGSKEDMI